MRTVLFYSGVDSFNYFTDQIEQELKSRGFETFILDLRNPEDSDPHSYANFNQFAKKRSIWSSAMTGLASGMMFLSNSGTPMMQRLSIF